MRIVKIIEVPIQQKQVMIDAQEEVIDKNMTQSYTVFKEKKTPQFKKYGFEEVTTGHKFNKKIQISQACSIVMSTRQL